jgi:hypothetical protein
VHMEQRDVEVAIARQVGEAVTPGWESVRFEVALAGNVTSGMLYVMRDGQEEPVFPPSGMSRRLKELKQMTAQPDAGSWLSLTMTLAASGGLDISYNFDEKPSFGFEVSARDYELELERFPRAEASVPLWWRERIARGDE